MSAPHLDVAAIANLARLELSPEEEQLFGGQLERILEHIAILERAEISGVEPTAHAHPVYNVVRPDEPVAGLPRQEALAIAARQAHHLFVVPKVIE